MSLLLGLGVLTGTAAWVALGRFLVLPHDSEHVEYLFFSTSLTRLAICVAAACALVGALRLSQRQFIAPLVIASLDVLALCALVPVFRRWTGPLVFIAVDLRWWRIALAAALLANAVDRRRGSRGRAALLRAWDGPSPRVRLTILDLSIALIAVSFATATTPSLRFSNQLHGDEPKYVRYCENLYEGNGFDLTDYKGASQLSDDASSHLARNLSHLVNALRVEARRITLDVRRFSRSPATFQFNRAQYGQAWFVFSKAGHLYQVHTPGISLLMLPFYYVDRHFLSHGETTYEGQFAGNLTCTNGFFLLMYAVWGIVIFRFLRNGCGNDALAWLTTVLATVSMPIAAFAFQMYPETTAGVCVVAVCNFLAFQRRGTAARAAWYGALAAYLPWLHVRFLGVAAVLLVWALLALRRDRRGLVGFLCPWVVGFAGLIVYVYHITGSVIPTALYNTKGAPTALSLANVPRGLLGFVVDRSYGLLPYSPFYVLAFVGFAPFARRAPVMAMVSVALFIALAVPSAAHSFTAAGGSPLRHIVALIPLVLPPVVEAVRRANVRAGVRLGVAVLMLLSVQTAVAYNSHHIKSIGAMVDVSVSGWKFNLLFPDVNTRNPIWPRTSPSYLPSPAHGRQLAGTAYMQHGCTMCVSSDHGRLTQSALASFKPDSRQ